MDTEKIGKFIAKMRKDKNLTQLELANKLNVTDRAVSNWENGRRIPDVSLFSDICNILDITVNELIAGEKIKEKEITKKTDENIIDTLNKSKKEKKKLFYTLLISFLIILLIFYRVYYLKTYPKIDIYNFDITTTESNTSQSLKKIFTSSGRSIYYYGINQAILCNAKDNCYQLKNAIEHKQTSLDKIKDYLEKQHEYGNIEASRMWDGGTTIYKKEGYTIIYCNTLDKNNDIYIGNNNMVNYLDGEYCGHEKSPVKTFIRTYYIVSVTDSHSGEYLNVTLREFQGETELVKIPKGANIVVGNSYEFTFKTYYEYADTIKNIFDNSQILSINKTDKVGLEQVNESIVINN